MNDFILETKNLTKRFGNQTAVDNISLKIKYNSIYGLLGQNGAGKTTTLKMIMELLRPTDGKIIFEGETIKHEHLTKMGSLIESPALYGNLTAMENLLVHTKLMGIKKERIYEVLDLVDLADTGKKPVSHFSMGMKQRLGIATALLGNPKLLILDEPTNGLDPVGIQKLRDFIISLPQKNMTVILSSHILSEVEQVVDDIGIIDKGKLLFQGKPSKKISLEKFYLDIIKGEKE